MKGTTFTDKGLMECPSCESDLGPFKAAPDGKPQIICSTCGLRGPYENIASTAEYKWNALPRRGGRE